jgi:uroporphyrinogen III methyltransferase/synthase
LRDQLLRVAEVEQVAVYSQVDSLDPASPGLAALRRGEIDYVTLSSSNIARAFLRALDQEMRGRIQAGQVRMVTISPVTSAAVHDLGFPVAAEASEYTIEGLVVALLQLAAQEGSGR